MKLWPFTRTLRLSFDADDAENTVINLLKHFPVEEGVWHEEQLLQKMIEDGMGERISWIVIGLMPIYAGRVLMEQLGPRFSDTVVLLHKNGRKESHLLSNFIPWRAILRNTLSIRSHPNFKTMALSGAEVNAVNQLLNSGSQPENLILTAPLLCIRG